MSGTVDASDDRRALLELLLAEDGLEVGGIESIPRRDPGAEPVLSFAQERLWFLEQLEAETAALSIRAALRLRGPLDVEVFRKSLDAVFVRHDSLRTHITVVGGVPKPQVQDATSMPLTLEDLRNADDVNALLETALAEEAQRTFDLEREFPIMARLVKLADDDHVLSIVMHHVASDGWSFRVFFEDLAAIYTAIASGRPIPLAELPVQYVDYAAWQRAWVSGENRDRQLEYWRDVLAGPLPTTEIPTDFIRPPTHTVEGEQIEETFADEIAEQIRRLATDTGTTSFMVLLAAFTVLVARHVDDDDLLIGTPVAGRVRPELERLVGVFLNTLVLRTDISGDPTFAEVLGRVRDVCLDAFDHQDVSFEQLLAELQPPRDLSRTPLFQIFFNMQTASADPKAAALPGMEYESLAQPEIGSKFDLTLYVYDSGDRYDLLLVYNRSLYRAETMQELLDQYVQLVGDVVADPRRPISDYSLVTPRARQILPDESAALDPSWHGSVPAAVRRAAARTPDRTAVVDSSVAWSYRSLENHMDRLATALVGRGLGKGDVVAIYGNRSASLVCAVTGVLATGAAYLLLDPRYPAERLCTILRVARPNAWLAISAAGPPPPELVSVLDDLGVIVRRSIPALDELDSLAAGEPPADIETLRAITDDIGPDDVACLTFTSGSTGGPKAVIGRHGSLTHFLPWQSDRFDVGSADRFSMLSGLAHDPIQRDMFWALWVGGTIVVPDPNEIGTPGWLAGWLRAEGVTVAHLTPAMGQLIADGSLTGRQHELVPSLRRAFFIGDSLIRRDVVQFKALAPNVEVVNLYGATETQRASGHHIVDFTIGQLDDRAPTAREVLPLGVGIRGTQLLVRGDSGGPAGIGEIGEIWFRSPHLAAGYVDRPDETRDRFFQADGDPNDRSYRTGDRGRYLPNGEVEFLGRHDDQVKVRGFRVELGEIRAAIVDQPHVGDAVVRTDHEPGSVRLVAYVVPADDGFDPPELRRALRDRLPGHMVPADFVMIPSVPLTPNGKLDAAALPSPAAAIREISAIEPRDQLERNLVGWWEEVLGRSNIGIHDDFFDLGGYSLLATRMFALIEANTGQRVPVSTLFEAPTIAELANVLRGDDAPAPWSSLVPVQPKGTQTPFFYVAPYMISVLQFAHLGDELGDDQPLYGLQPQGLDGALPIHDRIEDMAAHYIRELRDVQPMGPYRIGGHCSGTWVAFEMARQLEAAGERIDSLVLVDQGPPNAGREPIKPMSYLLGRLRFYFRDGRLRHAMAWQGRIIFNALLLRRVGTKTVKYTEGVKASHRAAYQVYDGGVINHDIALIRSEESMLLADKDWYLRWDQKTTGGFHHCRTIGTHANLLEQPYVKMLADRIRWAFQLSHADEEVA